MKKAFKYIIIILCVTAFVSCDTEKGYEDFRQHKDKQRRKNYLTRSAGIRNKSGKLTKDDPFSPNYWARKELW